MISLTETVRLRLIYTPFADLVAGLVGKPGEGYLLSPDSGFFVYVRRDNPAELLAFQIEHFSESFTPGESETFESILGQSIAERLAELWEKIPKDPQPLRGLSDEDLERSVSNGRIELFFEIPEADEAARAARIQELDRVNAWA